MKTIANYDYGNHSSLVHGYMHPEIILDFGLKAYNLIRKIFPNDKRFILVGPPVSGIVLSTSILLHFPPNYARIIEPNESRPMNKLNKLIFIDDAICTGNSLSTAYHSLGRTFDLTICIYIDDLFFYSYSLKELSEFCVDYQDLSKINI